MQLQGTARHLLRLKVFPPFVGSNERVGEEPGCRLACQCKFRAREGCKWTGHDDTDSCYVVLL